MDPRGCRLYVAYIATAAERTAFKRLRTDEEREKFIEQFWLRRDPTYKEEHYRRIAYSNGRFKTAAIPGWKTDRGRIYIIYGPPDEIESHPAGQSGGTPFEFWRYHHIEGVGDNVTIGFMDSDRNGNYRTASFLPTPVPRVSVEVDANGVARISVPLIEGRPAKVSGQVRTEGRVVTDFQDEAGPAYKKSIALPPGSYVLNIVVEDAELGSRQEEVGFEVQ